LPYRRVIVDSYPQPQTLAARVGKFNLGIDTAAGGGDARLPAEASRANVSGQQAASLTDARVLGTRRWSPHAMAGGVPTPRRGALVIVAKGGNSPRRAGPGRAKSSWRLGSGSTAIAGAQGGAHEVLKFSLFQGEAYLGNDWPLLLLLP
jgi:hypothetical protein